MTKASVILLGLIASAAMVTAAQEQPEATFDERGRITDRPATDSVLYFGAEITGRETPDGGGVMNFDDRGRVVIRKRGFEHRSRGDHK